jgi:hypothetical protein
LAGGDADRLALGRAGTEGVGAGDGLDVVGIPVDGFGRDGEETVCIALLGSVSRIDPGMRPTPMARPPGTVLDCALFHALDDEERREYVASLASVTEPGAML